jgi:protein involved in polysaccharide export with SLBB domain
MMVERVRWLGRQARAITTVCVVCCGGGCAFLPDAGRPVAPYRPEAKPFLPQPSVELTAIPSVGSADGLSSGATSEASAGSSETVGRVLRSGDRLLVTIHAPPEPFSSQHVVDEKGQINLPFIGVMTVAGKSCSQAQKDIEAEYIGQKIYKMVTVIIVPPESEYSVSGEMLRPGPYPLTRNQTVLQALARAGRYTDYADQSRVFLIRGNDRIEISLDDIRKGKQRDVVVIPGDVIEVPRSPW